jgi:uncharacterized protein YndB with AHSA1/START domain
VTEFSIAVDIAAPPERVWAVMSDVEGWPEWTPNVTRVERLDGGPLVVGSRTRIRQPKLLPAIWQVTELRDGRSFTWITRSPGVRVTARHGVEPAPGGTRATLSLWFSGPLATLVAWVTRGLNQRYLALEAKGLDARSIHPDWSFRSGAAAVGP